MFQKSSLNIVILFVVSLFTVAKCIHEDDLIWAPISAEIINKPDDLILQRMKRQVFGLGAGRRYPVAAQSRAPTVIVVPERGTATGRVPTYSSVPISPYSVSSPNKGTTVVVSQIPEYDYNGVARSYDIMPMGNPIRI